ncbi:MAG: alpha-2-macroglobulin family protein [Thermoanaerobaculia bacterium]
MHRTTRSLAFVLAITASVGLWTGCRPADAGPRDPQAGADSGEEGGGSMSSAQRWKEIDRLVEEDRFQAALDRVEELLASAREAGDGEEQTRALVRAVQLRMGLHGYETAVRWLADERWPDDPLQRTVLDLFYAHSLVQYLRVYSWEIGQRERVVSDEEVDLAAWTSEQIAAAAEEAFLRAWALRESWGTRAVDVVDESIDPGSYPETVRGTLRDAVSYLFAEHLADSSLWSAEESNGVYRLDVRELLAGPAVAAEEAGHPLEAMAVVLHDLAAWHRRGGRPEAAFEAERTLAERLHGALQQEEDREAIRAALRADLDRLGKERPWWSMGMATLAEMVRQETAPDAAIRAHAVAAQGEEAHPESLGGRRCRAVRLDLEAPGFSLQAMSQDGLERRSLLVRHKNVPTLDFRAYAFELVARVESSQDYNLLPAWREVETIVRAEEPVAEWSVDLPATEDLRFHDTYVVPSLPGPGAYVVVASARPGFRAGDNRRSAVVVVVSDLVLAAEPAEEGWRITARSGRTGEPIAGARLSLYRYDYRRGHRRVAEAVTDGDGVARLSRRGGDRGAGFFLLGEADGERALLQLQFYAPSPPAGESTAALVYTDRSVYRPRQEVLWKVVAYRRGSEADRFAVLQESAVRVELVDANGEVVESAEATTNGYGSASGRFTVPQGRLLGSWQIRSTPSGSSAIRVEEYKRPTFEVSIAEPEEALRLNRPATLSGEARYYFGLPVASGEVRWQVVREPVYPYWWGWWGWPLPRQGSETVAAGAAAIAADGTFEVRFTPAADERLASSGVSYAYRLSADVTDEGGETRSASRSFRLGFVSVEARIDLGAGFLTAGEPATATITRTDLDGAPRAGEGSWRLVRLAQPEHALLPAEQPKPEPPAGLAGFETPGDRQRPRWAADYDPDAVLRQWPAGERIAAGTAEHGEDGVARVELPALSEGAYRLLYESEDPFGATVEARDEVLVVGEGTSRLELPGLLEVESTSVAPGGVLRLAVHSGLPDQRIELEIRRPGRDTERRILRSTAGPRLIEVPIERSDRGGLALRLLVLRDHQEIELTRSVFVPWEDRRLDVSFATFRDRLRPGQSETWRIRIAGADGEAVAAGAAEILAYMYDRSLDLFAPHQPPDPLAILPGGAVLPWRQGCLGGGGEVWSDQQGWAPRAEYPTLAGASLKLLDGYGIGGPGRYAMPMRRLEGMARADAPMMVADEMAAPAPEPSAAKVAFADAEERQGSGPTAPAEEPELRSDFAETAFWEPHLITGADGSVAFEFTVPDSVTEWNVWVHALTRDLRGGSTTERVKTVKELLVRPYLPRFLREGDEAALRVAVQNAGETRLAGTLDFDIEDPAVEGSDLLAEFGLDRARAHGLEFSVEPGGTTTLELPVRVPARVGEVAFRVVGRAGDLSDGELRPLPVLPGRFHLVESRFAALRDADRRELVFEGMRQPDPSRIDDQLVVTLDAQLFYGVLSALPYLVDYPYECSEQTLNRFLSTGIVSSVFERYPAVAAMAEGLAERETRYESWKEDDPNRTMELVETPWLAVSRGGPEEPGDLIRVLDPEVARAHRTTALAQLERSQTSLGGFPWWPGGPPSPYMTLYILYGFSKALEFDVEVPQPMVQRAWGYMHRHYLDTIVRESMEKDCCWELVTFLDYVLSAYPDDSWTGGVFTADERQRMLDFSWEHWTDHSPMLKLYLALTLERRGRSEDARRVLESVLDSAHTDRDLGTYWAPEERAWLWYNDTVETQAVALRVLSEILPDDARRQGLVQWLFLNKQLNHWKSTRTTAEAVYSLVWYLEHEGELGATEAATVRVGPRVESFTFDPASYTGKDVQVVVPGEQIDPDTMSSVVVEKETPGLLFASATWHYSTEKLPEEADGDLFRVERRYFRRLHEDDEWVLRPLGAGERLEVGDQVEVQLEITARHAAEYVHLRDPRPAGFEPETLTSGYRWELGIGRYEEVRDSGTDFFVEWLPAGTYTLKHRLRANVAGTFKAAPAQLQSMYAPEFAAHSSGREITVLP